MGIGDPIPGVIEMNMEPGVVHCFTHLANALGLRYWHVGHKNFSYVKGAFEGNITGVMVALQEAGVLAARGTSAA
jgi:hypothetical protein